MARSLIRVALSVALVAGLTQLGVAHTAAMTDSQLPVVDVQVGPAGIVSLQAQRPGTVRIRVATSNQPTALGLIRLHRGVPLERVLGAVRRVFDDDRNVQVEAGKLIQRSSEQLGTAAVVPGFEVAYTATLWPGRYYLIDYHRVYENSPGTWVRSLDVRPGSPSGPATVQVPALVMDEPRFHAPTELKAGAPFRVINIGEQPNEAALMPVSPGTTREELLAFFRALDGGTETPPYPFVGEPVGMGPISPGYQSVMTTSLPPGRYALVTWFPDFEDTHMLAAKGMVTMITLT